MSLFFFRRRQRQDMKHTVTLAGQGWRFDTEAPETVLESAELAGVRLPSSCRNGTCRTCICLSTRGTVPSAIYSPALRSALQSLG